MLRNQKAAHILAWKAEGTIFGALMYIQHNTLIDPCIITEPQKFLRATAYFLYLQLKGFLPPTVAQVVIGTLAGLRLNVSHEVTFSVSEIFRPDDNQLFTHVYVSIIAITKYKNPGEPGVDERPRKLNQQFLSIKLPDQPYIRKALTPSFLFLGRSLLGSTSDTHYFVFF